MVASPNPKSLARFAVHARVTASSRDRPFALLLTISRLVPPTRFPQGCFGKVGVLDHLGVGLSNGGSCRTPPLRGRRRRQRPPCLGPTRGAGRRARPGRPRPDPGGPMPPI